MMSQKTDQNRRTSDRRLDNIEKDVRDLKIAFLGDLKENKEGIFTRLGKVETKVKILVLLITGVIAKVLHAAVTP